MSPDEQPHYFSSEEGDLSQIASAPRDAHWDAFGRSFTAKTDRGVFSYDHLDRGTAVLFSLVDPPQTEGTFLDLGCGWGPIALCLASLSPGAHVWAVDVNPRARGLVIRNRDIARASNIHVSSPEDVPAETRFDLIWSNPPIRIGKAALHKLLLRWLSRLTPNGAAWLVVQKNLGSDSLADWLETEGYLVQRIGSKKGFRVLVVKHA